MAPRFPLSVVLAATLLLGTASGAHASGVTIDPDSPAGREYALPLDTARSGGGGKKQERSESTPRSAESDDGGQHRELFGAGVGDDRATGDGTRSASPTTTAESDTTTERKRRTTTTKPPTTTERAAPATETATTDDDAAAVAATSDDGGGSGTAILIAVGVLIVGAIVGLLLRGRPRRSLDGPLS